MVRIIFIALFLFALCRPSYAWMNFQTFASGSTGCATARPSGDTEPGLCASGAYISNVELALIFNETSGTTVYDNSGNNRDFTIFNATPTAAGLVCGDADYASLATKLGSPASITVFVVYNATDGGSDPVDQLISVAGSVIIETDTDAAENTHAWMEGIGWTQLVYNATANGEHTAMFTAENGAQALYVDGTSRAVDTVAQSIAYTTNMTTICDHVSHDAGYGWTGTVKAVYVWSEILDSTAAASLHSNPYQILAGN